MARPLLSMEGRGHVDVSSIDSKTSSARGFRNGLSLFDVMITLGLTGALIGVGVASTARRNPGAVTTARHDLADELRKARMQATLGGARVRFEAQGGQYLITRLSDADGDGTWEWDATTAPHKVDLPTGISVNAFSGSASAVAEFDGRGFLVPSRDGASRSVAVTVTDHTGRSELLQISPSGYIDEAASIS